MPPLTTIRDATFPDDLAVVRILFREYGDALGYSLCFQGFEDELARLPGKYARPHGGVWLAVADDKIAGCVALRPHSDGECEMKRLYVRPAFRGGGVGRALTEHVLNVATQTGYRRLLLDTLPTMTGAIALYRALGFADVPPYYHNPVPGALFLARELSANTIG
jgi:putative acetyltransferase